MFKRVAPCLSALLISFVTLPAVAAIIAVDVSLIPPDPAETGRYDGIDPNSGLFDLTLSLDSATTTAIIEGEIVISYDAGLATFVTHQMQSPAFLWSGPTSGANGGLTTLTIGFTDAPVINDVMTLTFRAFGPVGSDIVFQLEDADQFFGTFVEKPVSNNPVAPDFAGTTVSIVSTAIPVPAAAWLMMSALGLLGFRVRRRA